MKPVALLAVLLLCSASLASARLFSSPEEWKAETRRNLQGAGSGHGHEHHGRYGVYGQEHRHHRYGVYGQEHKHHGYGAYGHHRRLASIESGPTRELQGFFSQRPDRPQHGHKHHGRYGVYGQEHKHRGYGVYGQGHKGRYGAYGRW